MSSAPATIRHHLVTAHELRVWEVLNGIWQAGNPETAHETTLRKLTKLSEEEVAAAVRGLLTLSLIRQMDTGTHTYFVAVP